MSISRRTVLGASTGVLAASAVTPGIALASAAPDWAALDRAVTGPVYRPGSSGYASSKLIFNTRYDGATPLAVVRPTGQADIQQTVLFAHRYGLRVSARTGGHSYVGASAASGTIIIDMRGMGWNARLNGTSATVYGGSTLYPVKSVLATKGRAIPTGTCPTVGAAGLSTGGGIGIESRKWGLTCDRITGMTVVTGSGVALAISATSHSDLFWALRGGGGGNGAIVTGMTFATHAATGKGTFLLKFSSGYGRSVLTGWARWMASTASTRWANVHVSSLANGSISISVVGVSELGDERAAASSLTSAIGVRPYSASYQQLSYMGAVRYFGGGTTSARQPWSAGSDILAGMSTGAANAILGTVRARSAAGGGGVAIIDPLTGAVSSLAASATAFPWRNHVASIQWYVGGSGYSSASRWISQAHTAVRSYSSGGYVNYLEAGTSMSRYLGGNYSRWRSVRAAYDPSGVIAAPITV